MRTPHYLKRTASDIMPSQIVIVSASLAIRRGEQQPDPDTWRACNWSIWAWRVERGQRTRERRATGTHIDAFWGELYGRLRAGTVTWIFSVNALTELATLGLWEQFENGLLSFGPRSDGKCAVLPGPKHRPWRGFAVLEDPPTILVCRHAAKRAVLRIVDIRNYGLSSLATLARSLGESEPVLPTTDEPAWRHGEYTRQVGSMVGEFIQGLCRQVTRQSLGALQTTAASQAYYGWRHSYMRHEVLVHDNQAVLDMEIAASYGGRCECRRIGSVPSPVYHLDVNSLYPWICANTYVPVRLAHHSVDATCPPPADDIIACFARCLISTMTAGYPYRPVSGDQIVYPTGTYRTVLAGPELLMAIQAGHVVEITEWASYDMAPALQQYARTLYDARIEASRAQDLAGQEVIKALLVGLPGKFGQRQRTWRLDQDEESAELFSVWWGDRADQTDPVLYRCLAGVVEYLDIGGPGRHAVPAISAWITSYGRARLAWLIEQAGADSVYYYDTDSLWVDEIGYLKLRSAGLISHEQMGSLKLVAVHRDVEFRGIKYYVADGRITCAGLPAGAKRLADGTYIVTDTPGAQEHLEKGWKPGTVATESTWRPPYQYRHGSVGSDGVVHPYHLEFVG